MVFYEKTVTEPLPWLDSITTVIQIMGVNLSSSAFVISSYSWACQVYHSYIELIVMSV